MANLNFDVTICYMDEDFTINIDDSNYLESDILEQLKEAKKERFEEQIGEDSLIDDENMAEDFEVTDWTDCPNWLQDFEALKDFFENYDDSYDIEIYEAAKYLDIPFSDVAEAYSGEFSNDEDFAEDMADQLGLTDRNAQWPQNCIDWEMAAKELMYDYCSHNNHYFRYI